MDSPVGLDTLEHNLLWPSTVVVAMSYPLYRPPNTADWISLASMSWGYA